MLIMMRLVLNHHAGFYESCGYYSGVLGFVIAYHWKHGVSVSHDYLCRKARKRDRKGVDDASVTHAHVKLSHVFKDLVLDYAFIDIDIFKIKIEH